MTDLPYSGKITKKITKIPWAKVIPLVPAWSMSVAILMSSNPPQVSRDLIGCLKCDGNVTSVI